MIKVSSSSGVIYEPVEHGPYRGVEVGENSLTMEDIQPTMTYDKGVDHDCKNYSDLLESGALDGAAPCEMCLVKRLKGGVALNHGMRVDAAVKVEWKIKSSQTHTLFPGWSYVGTELAINAIAYERF